MRRKQIIQSFVLILVQQRLEILVLEGMDLHQESAYVVEKKQKDQVVNTVLQNVVENIDQNYQWKKLQKLTCFQS